jgi:DNA repair exonuclease SbcCD ATPase subunit
VFRRSRAARLEKKLKRALKKLEAKERELRALRRRLESTYAQLPPLLRLLELARSFDRELYERFYPRVREAHSEAMELANRIDELQSTIEGEMENLRRLLALIQVLRERSRGRWRW